MLVAASMYVVTTGDVMQSVLTAEVSLLDCNVSTF